MERNGLTAGETLLIVGAVVVAAVGGAVWAGAFLAALAGGQQLDATFSMALEAAVALPSNASDPAQAWPPEVQASLPGLVLYWAATALAAAVIVSTIVVAVRLFRLKVGTVERRPLGVDARARFASLRDLAPLLIRQPERGRFIVGRFGRRLVATEVPHHGRGRRSRPGDRGAVALIGPSRSGKTTAAIGGILEWEGPAVLSSVKSDLLATTYGWRKGQGDVLVYDPTGTTSMTTTGWSPLREAGSIIGSQRAARSLCDAAPRDDSVDGGLDFWLTQAEILLSGLLWVAAQKDQHMSTVCEWVMVQDSPDPETGPGTVMNFVNEMLASEDPEIKKGATQASRSLLSVWRMEERTRSSVYATAQSVVWPWADPGVADASNKDNAKINLDWLLSTEHHNSVYLCAPIEDQQRLAPAFGGLLNDIIRQAYLRVAKTNKPLDPPLLIVIDEAGNTPLRALPEYASTLAGLGVLMVTIWQSLAQIEEAYGGKADTIITNHLSKVFYGGQSDPSALRYLAQVLGDVEVDTTSRTRTVGPDSTQISTTHLPLVPPHVARQMRPGGALLIHGTLPPAHIRTRSWWKDRSLSARVPTEPPSEPPKEQSDQSTEETTDGSVPSTSTP